MITHDVDGHTLEARIHTGAGCAVYRGTRDADGTPVVIKVPVRGATDPKRLERLRREAELGAALQHPRLVQTMGTARCGHSLALVMPDFGGVPLRKVIPESGLDLSAFFELAVPLAEAVVAVHDAEIIHKDINPSNIVVNPATNELRIIDFGISSRLPRESRPVVSARLLEGTLRYLAPEQTGRLNRSVTRRADLYALGATYYEMLTGSPPFDLTDDLELVHHHLAVLPEAPSTHRATIPKGLDALVLKLLAKSPPERYKSAQGVLRDLTRMQAQLRDFGKVRQTEVGGEDFALRFEVPEALYGRESHIAVLDALFVDACRGRAKTVFVQGPAGIGKSALIAELHRPVSAARGHLVSGKFDQLGRSEPYSAICSALDEWVGHVLAQDELALVACRQRVAKALGDNGALLTALVPRLGRLLPDVLPVPDLEGAAAEARFTQAVLAFLGAAASKDQPLVLFLDDLQWADVASINLLHAISSASDEHYLLTIGAFRDAEIETQHPVARLQRSLAEEGIAPEVLRLGSLSAQDVRALVADALHLPVSRTTELSDIVLERTGGNPFFVVQFLEALYRDQQIGIDPNTGEASWNVAAIISREYTSNVVELMIAAIRELSPATQRVVQTAACVGNRFDGELLARVLELDQDALREEIDEALVRGLLMPVHDSDELVYRFLHDRVQEAAYEMLDEAERVASHGRIGRILRAMHALHASHSEARHGEAQTPKQAPAQAGPDAAALGDAVFEVVRHLNVASPSLTEVSQRRDLAQLNLQAARRARASAAFDLASRYCKAAADLLTDAAWVEDYPLARGVHALGAEAALLCGEHDNWEAMARAVETHAKTALDRVPIAELRIRHLNGDNLLGEAVELALNTLSRLGVELPRGAGKLPVIGGVIRTKWAIRGRPPEDFHDLPRMKDPVALAAMRVLSSATTSAYHARPSVLPHIVFAMMGLSLRHGNAPHSPNGFMGYALALNGPMNDPEGAYAYGKFALALSDRLDAKALRARVEVPFNIFIRHWNEPLQATLDPLANVFFVGLEVGDLEYAVLGPQMQALHELMLGAPLRLTLAQLDGHTKHLGRFRQRRGEIMVGLYRGFARGFHLVHDDPADLTHEGFVLDEVIEEVEVTSNHTAAAGIRVARVVLWTHYGEAQNAVDAWPDTEPRLEAVAGTVWLWAAWFHVAISAIILEQAGRATSQTKRLIREGRKRLQRWAARCPSNFAHKYELLLAEIARRDGQGQVAAHHFAAAVEGATRNGFESDLTLAAQRAADFYAASDQLSIARMFAQRALAACDRWDAQGKAMWLCAHAPELYERAAETTRGTESNHPSRAASKTWSDSQQQESQALDLQSVLKGASAISGQIDVEDLTHTLLEVVIESAGARRGVLILGNDANARVVGAQGPDLDEADAKIEAHPLRDTTLVPQAIARYVLNTTEAVTLEDARHSGPYVADAQVQALGLRSVICLPLRRPGHVLGAIYLDNNLIAGAFASDRVEVLELLASQIAISLQNATLYQAQAEALRKQTALHEASNRFVPHQFIRSLERKSLLDVSVGDCVRREMSVLFSDMRNFTTLIESLSPDESIAFINEYLGFVEPAILGNSGFIDTYLGDGVMALFDTTADNALRAAITMQRRLREFSASREAQGLLPVRTGVGINTGDVMLGTIGGQRSMKCGVIGDAVNLAARIEPLTKRYGAMVLISGQTRDRLADKQAYSLREVDRIRVKGKREPTLIIEALDALPDALRETRERTLKTLAEGRQAFAQGDFTLAAQAFRDCTQLDPTDTVPKLFLERCNEHAQAGVPDDWDGVVRVGGG